MGGGHSVRPKAQGFKGEAIGLPCVASTGSEDDEADFAMGEHWTPLDDAIVLIYIVGTLAMGWIVSRRIRSFEDFFLAGRALTTPLLVGGLVATYYGLDVTFGSSETAYYEGISTFFAYSAPFYVAYLLVATVIAPRVHGVEAFSLPDIMDRFYGKTARWTTAAAAAFYSLPILSVFGMGLLGSLLFGWPPIVGALIGGAIACVYTIMGGLLADSLTDTVQFALMAITAAIACGIAMSKIGGYEFLKTNLDAPELFHPLGTLSVADLLVYGLIALSPLVEPAFYQRILAAKSARSVRNALLIGIALWVAFDWVVVYLGMVGRYQVEAGILPSDLDPSSILLSVVATLLPTGLIGLFAIGLIATAMSTIDSYALIAAGSIVRDGVPMFRRRPLSARATLFWTRVCVALTILVSLLLALRFERIRDAWIFMASILVSTVLIPLMVALLRPQWATRRAGSWGCATGFIGALTLFVAFETVGVYDPEMESRGFQVANIWIYREHAILFTVPLACAAFCLGRAADLSAGKDPTPTGAPAE